ncbi:MAG TPA: response regulator [Aggregatilineales bacterium]|nr:response regulator [Aggregatilineales bacterium]
MNNPSNWKVILVDDEPDSLKLVHDMLTASGVEVFDAANGSQGLSLLEKVQPTMVIVDLSMPHPDGWDLLQKLRSNPTLKQTPVVAITAYYSDEVERRAQEAGFSAFVRKPIRVKTFLNVLTSVLNPS